MHFLIVVPELKVLRESYVKLINGLKVQGDNLFQHFISVGIVTLEDYNDFDEKPWTKRSKAKWFVDKISSHLTVGFCNSFYKMLLIMEERGDIVCQQLSEEMKTSLAQLKKTFTEGMLLIVLYYNCDCESSRQGNDGQ